MALMMGRWDTQHRIICCVLHFHQWYCHPFYAQSSTLLLNQMVLQFVPWQRKPGSGSAGLAGDRHLLSAKIFPPFLEWLQEIKGMLYDGLVQPLPFYQKSKASYK